MKKLISAILLFFLLSIPVWAAENLSVVELQRLAKAGASLIIDLEKTPRTPSELVLIAKSLATGSTLTIRDGKGRLTVSQCLQIVQARSGQVQFWF